MFLGELRLTSSNLRRFAVGGVAIKGRLLGVSFSCRNESGWMLESITTEGRASFSCEIFIASVVVFLPVPGGPWCMETLMSETAAVVASSVLDAAGSVMFL